MRDRLLHFLRKQPVPQAEQVVRSPADDEGCHNHDAHLQSPHPGFGDVVVRAAEVNISWQHWEKTNAPQMTVWLSWTNQADVNDENDRLTVVPGHATRDFHQDSCVAEDHDDQGQEEEAHKGEHVVEGLLPVLVKTAVGGALGEVLGHRDGYIVKNKHLREKKRWPTVLHLIISVLWGQLPSATAVNTNPTLRSSYLAVSLRVAGDTIWNTSSYEHNGNTPGLMLVSSSIAEDLDNLRPWLWRFVV